LNAVTRGPRADHPTIPNAHTLLSDCCRPAVPGTSPLASADPAGSLAGQLAFPDALARGPRTHLTLGQSLSLAERNHKDVLGLHSDSSRTRTKMLVSVPVVQGNALHPAWITQTLQLLTYSDGTCYPEAATTPSLWMSSPEPRQGLSRKYSLELGCKTSHYCQCTFPCSCSHTHTAYLASL
jgi:hypothetical protein